MSLKRARCAVLVACLSAVAIAQSPDRLQDPAAVHVDRLCVKFAEGSAAELVGGHLRSGAGCDFTSVERHLAGASLEPLVTAVPRRQLDAWHAHACDVLPEGRRPGHLGLWFRVRARDAATAAAIAERLDAEPLVEHMHYEPKLALASAASAAPQDLPPTTPLFTSLQHTFEPTPTGHGIWQSQGIYGARGAGVGFYQLEGTYILDHEDVSQLVAANFLGVPSPDDPAGKHGTAGAGILCADRNQYGITGAADEATARFLCVDLNGGLENSMALALAASQPGDVLMMVVMTLMPSLGPGSWIPIEFFQSVFDASLTVTANGRSLVATPGNGNMSLDDPMFLGRFDRSYRDSGAVFVGATAGALLQRASYCNWGSRVDVNGWGDQVATTSYGTIFFPNNDLRQAYTASYAGTSASTPHIAAVLLMLQGAAQKQLGRRLTNAELMDALHTFGPGTPDVIGRRFDVAAAMAHFGIADGLSLQSPDVPAGGTITAQLDGPFGSILALFGSLVAADIPIGWNRNLHLDPLTLTSVGAWVLTGSPATYTLPVPASTSLYGVDLFFQAVRLQGSAPLEFTNSVQVTVL
ncbi:MAG: hypothetical protein JNN13_14530 [Planctomycetes bacterium]|nr:hypothetical protein [Planctomycetota bacterium]